jgi:hypothetical protein
MKELTTGLLLGAILLGGFNVPAQAQYHKNYGGSRVTNQNQTGLYHNDPSYISAGTMSRSAQGKNAGVTNAGLPSTSWGGYIRNPGDDIYTGNNGAMRKDNGSMVYGDEIANANRQKAFMAQQRQQQMMMMQMQQRQQVQQGNYYVPGSNGSAANYGSNGVAVYGSYKK